jgi:hypothetical protein
MPQVSTSDALNNVAGSAVVDSTGKMAGQLSLGVLLAHHAATQDVGKALPLPDFFPEGFEGCISGRLRRFGLLLSARRHRPDWMALARATENQARHRGHVRKPLV